MRKSVIFLTFDVEEFYNAELLSKYIDKKEIKETNLEKNVDILIDLCNKYEVKSTSFILGEVAKNKPQIVKKLYNAGHEVASHSYSHKLIYNISPGEFKNDLRKSKEILEDLTGKKVIGYRAPSWSVKKEILEWYYEILIENEIKYSSSIFPGKTFLYGIPDAPDQIHRPVVNGKEMNILEIPQYVKKIVFLKSGFSGGFYLRFYPLFLLKLFFKNELKNKNNFFIYLHPYEISKFKIKSKIPFLYRIIQFYNLKNTEHKLSDLILSYKENISSIGNWIAKEEKNINNITHAV